MHFNKEEYWANKGKKKIQPKPNIARVSNIMLGFDAKGRPVALNRKERRLRKYTRNIIPEANDGHN